MRINTNVSSLIARENAVNTNSKIQSSLEKLSSGLKINKASDDASGLAIADKLRTQATSIKQGVANGSSAVSLLQIADKSMAEQSNILDVIKAKLIQANSDTTSDDGREAIRKDIKKLLEQLDNIAEQTNYNGTKLLDTSANVATSASGSVTSEDVSISGGTAYDATSDETFNLTTTTSNTIHPIILQDLVNKGTLTFSQNSSIQTNFAGSDKSEINSWLGGLSGVSSSSSDSYDVVAGTTIDLSSYGSSTLSRLEIFGDATGEIFQTSGISFGTITPAPSASVSGTKSTGPDTVEAQTFSSGLSFQIGESSDDLINSSHIQSNTLGLGGGSEALVQTSGASNQNNLIASNESMIFSISDGNSAIIDAHGSSATNVTLSGEISTLSSSGTSLTLSNMDNTTYTLLNTLVSNMDGTSGSETVGTVTVNLSDGATITKSGGEFTLSNGGSLTFSDGYEIASMDVVEGSASGSISVSNATDVLVTNLSNSATVAITSSASGSLTGGQTLISLKNLEAGELTQAKASQFQSVVDSAISGLNALRGEIGSTQNQVESAVRNLLTQHTNVKAAESIIRDVDYANESGNFNKQSIIAQAGSYAITQANSAQQNILRLLN